MTRIDKLRMKLAEWLIGGVAHNILHQYLSADNYGVTERALEETWVSKDGRKTKIKDMTAQHCKHTLALLIRTLRGGNNMAYLRSDGRIAFRTTTRGIIDGEFAWFEPDGGMNHTVKIGESA